MTARVPRSGMGRVTISQSSAKEGCVIFVELVYLEVVVKSWPMGAEMAAFRVTEILRRPTKHVTL